MRFFGAISAITLLFLSYVSAVNAQSQSIDDDARAAIANLISEITECSVFYGIIGQGKDSRKTDKGPKFQNLSEELILTSADLAATDGTA